MHYIESGAGTPLLLLHAFPLDARMWNEARTALEGHVRVITPDQRGLGESPLEEPEPGMDVLAADVLALMDTLDLPRAVLGGCSMGGYVAMAVLRAAPERVAGLLLVDTKSEPDNPDQAENRLSAAARAEREGVEGWLADNMVPNVLGATTREHNDEVVAAVRGWIDEQAPEGVAWAQRAMASRPDSAETLRRFPGPALVVVGEEDAMTPPESAMAMAGLLPRVERITLAGVGHLSPIEAPQAFADAVTTWVDGIGV